MTHRIAVLGLHHDHVWSNLEELSRLPNTELVGAFDSDSELREKFSSLYEAPVFASDDDLFAQADGVTSAYIFGSNKLSAELTLKACALGLHCLVEKPMASTGEEAQAMLDAAASAGVKLMINWPFAWWPQLQEGIRLAQHGAIGEIWQVKYRAAHQGPVELGCSKQFCDWLYDAELNGAGALMDYCCYGAVLADVLMGKPNTVSATSIRTGQKPNLPLEDNAILVMNYRSGLATSEASWTQIGDLTSYQTVIHGTAGTLLIEPDHGGRLIKATLDAPGGVELSIPQPDPTLVTGSANFVASLDVDDANLVHPLCRPEHGLNAQRILDAGLQSARQNGAGVSVF